MIGGFGREVAAAGLGLDIGGAIFLGVNLLDSPVGAASFLFSDPSASASALRRRPGCWRAEVSERPQPNH